MAAAVCRPVCLKTALLKAVNRRFCGPRNGLFFTRKFSSNLSANESTENSTESSSDDEFRVFIIPGHNEPKKVRREQARQKKPVPPARYQTMTPDQDWTSAWPAAETFKWSAAPFPVRQGMVFGEENDGIPPKKYANAELMKLPNFLHLTPAHIKKHCAAIKQFCTPWPAGLETDELCDEHFPVKITTTQYLVDGPSVRDSRARVVTLKVKLESLSLDYHARDKLLRLAGTRYNPATDELTITADSCPTRKQNYDYSMYLLTVLFHESWKTESWEADKTLEDMEKYVWDMEASSQSLTNTISRIVQDKEEAEAKPSFLSSVGDDSVSEDLREIDEVKEYGRSVESIMNVGETVQSLNEYKNCVTKLLIENK